MLYDNKPEYLHKKIILKLDLFDVLSNIKWPKGSDYKKYGCCLTSAEDGTPIMARRDEYEIFNSDFQAVKFFYIQMIHGVSKFKEAFNFCEQYGNEETLKIIRNVRK